MAEDASMGDHVSMSDHANSVQSEPSVVCESSTNRKRTSDVWNHFTKDKDPKKTKAYCNYCKMGIESKHGTSSLRKHSDACVQKKLQERGEKSQLQLGPNMTPSDSGTNVVIPYRFDQARSREDIARCVIMLELPFRTVEHPAFQALLKNLRPEFRLFKRNTVKSDCMALFEKEKQNLKDSFVRARGRISLTSDMWTSNQTLGYMSLTAHYIDEQWKLQKKIINFKLIEDRHTKFVLSFAIESCLSDWNIEHKIFGLTLDNASTNTALIPILREKYKFSLPLSGEFFHIRCSAHILNLIVKEGLKELDHMLTRVRDAVKYVKGSQNRLEKFNEILKQLKLNDNKRLCLDVPTRWNSTYLMLSRAFEFKEAFTRLVFVDTGFNNAPDENDWENAMLLCKFLKVFYDSTNMFSSSKVPTANIYFHEVCMLKLHLRKEWNDHIIMSMATKMAEKLDQYWEEVSLILAIAVVLDPQHKMRIVEFWFRKLHGSIIVASPHIERVRDGLQRLFNYYEKSAPPNSLDVVQQSSGDVPFKDSSFEFFDDSDINFDQEYALYTQVEMKDQSKTELENYLDEQVHPKEGNFDILKYWEMNQKKWPILSRMAVDVLAIPISTVASESAFSTGGRVLDQFRSSLNPKTVEALICTQDWLRNSYSELDDQHTNTHGVHDEENDD